MEPNEIVKELFKLAGESLKHGNFNITDFHMRAIKAKYEARRLIEELTDLERIINIKLDRLYTPGD